MWLIDFEFVPVVTIYATLGEEAIAHGINETEVSFVITTHDLLPKFKTILKSTPKVKTIIYMEDQLSETDTSGLRDDVNIIAFKEVVKKGEALQIGIYIFCTLMLYFGFFSIVFNTFFKSIFVF